MNQGIATERTQLHLPQEPGNPGTLNQVPPASVLDTLVLVNHTFLNGNSVPENAAYPTGIDVDRSNEKVFIAGGDGGIAVVNASTNRLVDVIQTQPAGQVYDVAYDPGNGYLYATHSTTATEVTVINESTDRAIKTIQVGDVPSGVTADPINGRVYVMNEGSANVSVINGSSNKVIGSIPVGFGPRYMAVDTANGNLFVTNNNDGTVTIINGATDAVLGTVTVGVSPGGITFDTKNGDMYIVNAGLQTPSSPNGSVTVLTGSSGGYVTTIPVGACPWGATYDNRSAEIYVTDTTCMGQGGYASVISDATNQVVGSLGTGNRPFAATYDYSNDLVYIANSYWYYNVTILNGTTHMAAGTIGTGELPSGLASDPSNGVVYLAEMGGNDVAMINSSTGHELGTIVVGSAPYALAYDASSGYVYVANSVSDNLSVVDTSTESAVGSIPVGEDPQGVALDPISGEIFVADCGSDNITIINGTTWKAVGTVASGICPSSILFDPSNGYIYAADSGPTNAYAGVIENVTVIDGSTNKIISSIPVGGIPLGMTYDSRNGYVYVVNSFSDNISVIDGASNRPIASVPLGPLWGGNWPDSVTYDAGNEEIFVTLANSNDFVALNSTSNQLLGSVAVGAYPSTVAIVGATAMAWVANNLCGTLSILNITEYPPPLYNIVFNESGLSPGTAWSVVFNSLANRSTSSSLAFLAHSGNYSYSVTAPGGYLAMPASGTILVNGANASRVITFSRLFRIAFDESGLKPMTPWAVIWAGTHLAASGVAIVTNATNGSYSFVVEPVPGFQSTPSTGILVVAGNARVIPVAFHAFLYSVDFIREGLSTHSGWTVTLAGTANNSTSDTIGFGEPNGTYYRFSVVLTEARCLVPLPASGALNVSGAPVTIRIQVGSDPGCPPPCSTCHAVSPPAQRFIGLPVSEGYAVLLGGVTAVVAVFLILYVRQRGKSMRESPTHGGLVSSRTRSPPAA